MEVRVVINHTQYIEEVLTAEIVAEEREDEDIEVGFEPIALIPRPADSGFIPDEKGNDD